MAFPANEPPINVITEGAGAALSGFFNFGGNRWLGFYAGVPTSATDGADWCGPGSIIVDITNFDIYMNTNTLASPTWTKKVD